MMDDQRQVAKIIPLMGPLIDVIKAAKRFDGCMSEFEGDLAACHEDMDALFDAVEKLRKEEDAIDNVTPPPDTVQVEEVRRER